MSTLAPIIVLGPQRPLPNLPDALRAAGVDGPVVTITAGWRHDEAADAGPLAEAIARPTWHLPLYTWFDQIMDQHPGIAAAYRARQARIRAYKHLYRIRLKGALSTVDGLIAWIDDDPELVRPELERAVRVVRRIDDEMLAVVAEIKDSVPGIGPPWEIPAIREFHARAEETVLAASAVCIAGGHVAVLRNRAQFFGLGTILAAAGQASIPVFAWSAGAMILTDRIVLYYDDPPAGPAEAEVLGTGFGLVPDTVLLPHARMRLRLDNRVRVENLALRFAPSDCVTLENGAWLERAGGGWRNRGAAGTASLLRSGAAPTDLPPASAEVRS